MYVFQAVLMKCVDLLNLRVIYAPYSFTFGSVILALGALSISIWFISRLLDR